MEKKNLKRAPLLSRGPMGNIIVVDTPIDSTRSLEFRRMERDIIALITILSIVKLVDAHLTEEKSLFYRLKSKAAKVINFLKGNGGA